MKKDDEEELPAWMQNELNSSTAEVTKNLPEMLPVVELIAIRAANIRKLLTTPVPAGVEKKKVILLGHEMLDEADNIKASIEQCDDLDLSGYFNIMSNVIEALERLIVFNSSNLGNKALRNHLVSVTNKVLLDTKILAVSNMFMDKFWSADEKNE